MQEHKKIEYYQLDLTEYEQSVSFLKELQNDEALIIGIELTDIEISRYCHLSIDPQHNNSSNSITSIEMIYKYQDKLAKMSGVFSKVALITIKPDLDSIGAMVLATLAINSPALTLSGDMLLRLIAIANSDRHGSASKWSKHKRINYFNEPLFSKFGIPIGLLSAIGSQDDIDTKVKYMTDYIMTGSFEKLDRFTAIMLKKNEISSKSTNVQVVIDNRLVFVESNYRGAIGLGYRYAPTVLAKNPNYRFGQRNIKGVKYTLAQFNPGHVNIEKVLSRLIALEPGWGGDRSSIIGSSQKEPSKLTPDQILDIVKQEMV